MSRFPHWHFRSMDPGEVHVDPVQDEFFKAQDLADALVREAIQNSVDARVPRPDAVRENWDVKRNRRIRGSTTESRPGNIRRLITSVQQLDFNYDLYGMRAEEILQLLPLELDAWKPAPLLRRGPSPGATRRPSPRYAGRGALAGVTRYPARNG